MRWRTDVGGDATSAPASHADAVYASNGEGIVALDPGDGSVQWEISRAGPSVAAPVVGGSVFAQNHHLYAFDEDTERWRATPAHHGGSSPTLTEDGLFLARSHVEAFDPETGQRRWTVDRPNDFTGPIVAGTDTLFVGASYEGDLVYALDPTDGSIRWSKSYENVGSSPLCVVDDLLLVGVANGELLALRVE